MRAKVALVVLGLLLSGGMAVAQDQAGKSPASAAAYGAVIACEAVAEPSARLACFDRTVATLAAEIRDKKVVVIDAATVREARRGLFGLSLPRLKLFDSDDDEAITEIDSRITGVAFTREGKAVFVLADGSRWRQTESRQLSARIGQPINIKRGAMGGYMATVNKRSGIRVIRLAE